MSNAKLKQGFARDVALLRLVGMKPIVVHGGGWGIDALLKKMGIERRSVTAGTASPTRARSPSSKWH